MMKKIANKALQSSKKLASRALHNKKGFSLAEMLIAVLIVAMVVGTIAGGGTVAKNAYQRVTLRAEAATLLSTTITKVTDEFRFASDVQVEEPKDGRMSYLVFQSGIQGCKVAMVNNIVPTTSESAVNYSCIYLVGLVNGGTIQGGTTGSAIDLNAEGNRATPLLTKNTMTSGLFPTITEVNYENGVITATINIYHPEIQDSDGGITPYQTQTISVRPINQ